MLTVGSAAYTATRYSFGVDKNDKKNNGFTDKSKVKKKNEINLFGGLEDYAKEEAKKIKKNKGGGLLGLFKKKK